ncbi:D-alanyl-D-alanine carboxypeptidase family protein [Salipaludibacillus daqingensis]|uniref:D-alanyl-D-alanine carboxypeptidase family protein n=1 Tax=Salipaludibacillus daqingensis TaxID=3041001 RepID=UPI0024767E49|nr:D-alanyl-D-alanine carboxypeptidase family protein [Salipaludibacillus daqingensis]
MKKNHIVLFFCGITILLLIGAEVSEDEAYNQGVSAQGAVLIEQESGRVLFEKEAETQMRIASITKIMTAILAIEYGDLDDTVKVSKNAAWTEGSSIYLAENEKILLKDLIYGLMLRSGNDAAVAIAEHVGGSLEGFVYLMNQKAEEIGMKNTFFSNPHGLDDHEEHYSTAFDMALLTQYAMKNPTYAEVSSTKSYTSKTEEDRIRVFKNKNRLLTQLYKYSTGGKTGYTKRAKRTLVSTAEKDDLKFIAVTINAPSDWNDHMNLFDWGYSKFDLQTVIKKGVVEQIEDPFYKDKLEADFSFEYPVSEKDKQNLSRRVIVPNPTNEERWKKEGYPSPIGTIQVELNNEVIGIVPLHYKGAEIQQESFYKKWLKKLFMINEAFSYG